MNTANKVSTNIVYHAIYQIIIFVIPLVVLPYLTRTLGETKLGIYNFSNSIASYFVLLCNLGIAKYGQREIARSRNNKIELSKTFYSLLVVHLLSSLVSITIFSILSMTVWSSVNKEYVLAIIFVSSAAIDVTWFFYGVEKFKIVTFIFGAFSIIKAALIFMFVKKPDDLWIFLTITYSSLFISYFTLFLLSLKTVDIVHISRKDCLKHFKPILFFSIGVAAVTLYTLFDKTLLGILTTVEDVAFYENANKIIIIPKAIIGVICTAIFPRVCASVKEGDIIEANRYINLSVIFTSLFSLGSIFGIFVIGKPFVLYYYGENFRVSGDVLIEMAPLIFIVTIGEIFRSQIMIPFGHDKAYITSLVLNALVNIVASTVLIRYLGIHGAVIGTTLAELFGLLFQAIYCKRYVSIGNLFKKCLPFVIIGIFMYGVLKVLIDLIGIKDLWHLVFLVVIGILIYSGISIAYLTMFSGEKIFLDFFNKRKNK